MTQKQNTLTKTGIVALLACVCCILWGSAIPVIKTGYRLMQVDSADTASQIVFAGVRFTLAGILVLIFASIKERKVMIPDREILKYAVPVCLAQTVGQYFFFYIGVAHTSGVKGAIITGLGNFIAILLSCLAFRSERMTGRKIAGCVLGFAGVVVINLMGNSLDMGFKLTGEGFILIAQLSYGISTVLINLFSRKVSPVVLSGTQFTMGGIVLTLIGVGMGGHLGNVTAGGVAIIFYLAMVSAVAYTLWSVLLACHKRPISAEQISKLVDDVEIEIFNREEKEIPSALIGEILMDKLKDLDPVAYVRFASVYREFKDVNTFMNELKKMLG